MKRFLWILLALVTLFCGCATTPPNGGGNGGGTGGSGTGGAGSGETGGNGGGSEVPPVEPPPVVYYDLNLPTHEHGVIKADKSKYLPGETVTLDVNPDEYYMVEEGSLKVNGSVIENNQFVMGEQTANVTVNFVKENIPDGYIYGANFKGSNVAWNMAFINFAKPVSLEGVESVILEVRFNQKSSGQWFRLCAGTSDGTVYDAFASENYSETSTTTHNYVIDHDPYFATPVYNWNIKANSTWEANWDGYDNPPTFHVEVPLSSLFAKGNYIDWQAINVYEPLNQSKYLNKIGVHVTHTAAYDFTIGRAYVRKNGIPVQVTDPANYSTTKQDGKDFAYAWKFADGSNQLSIELHQPTCVHKKPKLLVLGDSIMTTWWSYTMVRDIADHFNADLIRDAVGGTTIGNAKGTGLIDHARQGLYKDYVEQNGAFDYVILQRGTNDLWFNTAAQENFMLGDENSVGLNTTFGSLKYVIEHLKELCPNVKIICSTLLYRNDGIATNVVEGYNETLKKVTSNYSFVHLFDLYNKSGINASNYTTYLAEDKLHPNKTGATLLTEKWIEELETVITK